MANRIKDALSPELYEYYKQNRGKYRKFDSDLSLLQAQLFKGMVDEGVFPATKHRHGWEYECDCVTWLNDITKKINTFNDFRKIFKNRLKNYKFKSPEYYAECERIVKDNDVEYVKASLRAQSVRNYVARNYSAPMPIQENKEAVDNNAQIIKKEECQIISSISGRSGVQPHDDKYSFHIEYELSYGKVEQIPYIVTKHCRESVYSIQSWDYQNEIKSNLNMTWEEFWRKYNDYIAGMDLDSLYFKQQCYAIILEELYWIKENPCKHKRENIQIDSLYDDRYDYDIIRENGYRSVASIPYIVTKHHKVDIRYFEGNYFIWNCEQKVQQTLNITWDDFYKKYSFCLSGMDKDSFAFKCQCAAILLEHGVENVFNDNIFSAKDDFEYFQFCLMWIVTFFVFGGIAYVFKHLIALVIYWIGYMLWLICNLINCIFGILLNYNITTLPLETDSIPNPLQIWQIGGYIYGSFVAIMVFGAIYCKIKNLFKR